MHQLATIYNHLQPFNTKKMAIIAQRAKKANIAHPPKM